MNELDVLRDKIDKIDARLLPLFLERMELCSEVADYKRATGKAVLDAVREREVLENKMKLLRDKSRESEVYEFFSCVMSISRDRQMREIAGAEGRSRIEDMIKPHAPAVKPKIVYQGVRGAYSEQAAVKYFGEAAERSHVKTFEDAFRAVESGDADYAVVPIENSSTGTVADNMDLLGSYGFYIVGEINIPIHHCLLGVRDAKLSDIKTVYSHEQGILQSREFLKTLGDITCEEYYNTAISAKMVAESGDKSLAAIASETAAKLYGLNILARDINSRDKNTTRFIVVSKNAEVGSEADKISAAFTIPHESGELHRVLACFARGGLNLLKIESRPLKDKNFEYIFYVDYTGSLLSEDVRRVTNNVIEGTSEFKLLGNYKAWI